jgi:hypothetical protein
LRGNETNSIVGKVVLYSVGEELFEEQESQQTDSEETVTVSQETVKSEVMRLLIQE